MSDPDLTPTSEVRDPPPHETELHGTSASMENNFFTMFSSGMEAILQKIAESMNSRPAPGNTQIKLMPFDPDAAESDIVNWCSLSDIMINDKEVHGVDLILALSHALKGRAGLCLTKIQPDNITWSSIREILISSFSKPMMMQDYFDQVIKFQIKNTESPAEAGLRLWQFIEKIPEAKMSEKVVTGFVISVLSQCDDKIRRELNSVVINDKHQLFRTLRSFTLKRRIDEPATSDNDAKRFRPSTDFHGHCHFCKKRGHRGQDCRDKQRYLLKKSNVSDNSMDSPKSNVICYVCHERGHAANTCPKRWPKKEDAASSSNNSSSSNSSSGGNSSKQVNLCSKVTRGVYLCYKNYAYYKANPSTMHQTTNLKGYAESIFSKPGTWLVILIAVAVLLLILVLIVIFLRNRIAIAIALIREGSKAVTAIKSTIFFPIFPWILQCFVIAYGVLVLMYLLSIGEPAFKIVNFANDTCACDNIVAHYTKDNEACDPVSFLAGCRDQNDGGSCKLATCHFTGLDNPHSVVYLHLANLLGFFWTMFFISGVSDMMLASTFSTWYWTYKKRDLPFFTLTSGISRTLRYHLGTVALGALIIAIVRVIRVILEWIDQKLKKFDNPLTKCLMCCCKCFCWCLENFLRFINKNAYIMCAVHGHNFCKSARDAFSLLMRNIIRVVVIDKVTDFLFFLSKLLISVGVGVGVYYLLQWNLFYEVTQGQPLHYNHIPAIILSIATYLICTIFFNVYEMAVDTLFLCFLEDCERNDGSLEKPYFMSKNLMKILGKRNKKS